MRHEHSGRIEAYCEFIACADHNVELASPLNFNPPSNDAPIPNSIKAVTKSDLPNIPVKPSTGASGTVVSAGSSSQPQSVPQAKAPEGRLGPGVPPRASSPTKLQSMQTAAISRPVSGDQTKSAKRLSRGSTEGKRRSGSLASSRHSKKATRVGLILESQDVASESTAAKPSTDTPKKKGGLSRFLALLNCCGVPENANTVDTGEQAVAAKKTNKLQPARGRQATPVSKAEASAVQSSAADSKETPNEKTGGPGFAEHTAPTEAKTSEVPKQGDLPEKPTIIPKPEPVEKEKEPAQPQSLPKDQPLPPLPSLEKRSEDHSPRQEAVATPSSTLVPVENPIPPPPHQDMAINDRTPQQVKRDSDIEMADAPPIIPIPAVSTSSNENREARVPQMSLPPPPPLNQRDAQASSAGVAEKGTSSAAAPNEKQQWLLPPLQPRFRGKKCLVLDLDETLVHSSFKVRWFGLYMSINITHAYDFRYFTKLISQYPWRSKGNITMYM